jgi:hypothetical protein
MAWAFFYLYILYASPTHYTRPSILPAVWGLLLRGKGIQNMVY